MATPSAQGMRDQGQMAQNMWGGVQGQGGQGAQTPSGYPNKGPAINGGYGRMYTTNGPQGVRNTPDVTSQPNPNRPPMQGPPGGIQNPGGGPPQPPPGVGTPGAPAPAQGTPAAPQAPSAGPAQAKGPVPPGTKDPYSGAPVNPDGSYQRSDGSTDWLPGYGPQMGFGNQTTRTGAAPVRPDPGDPDSVTGGQRGTPQWRAAYDAHQQWIKENLDSGRTLADLGMEPTRGGGLSNYMKWGSYQPQGGGARPQPGGPQGVQQGPGTGGYLPEGGFMQPGGNMSYGGFGFGGGNPLQNAVIQMLMGGGGGTF